MKKSQTDILKIKVKQTHITPAGELLVEVASPNETETLSKSVQQVINNRAMVYIPGQLLYTFWTSSHIWKRLRFCKPLRYW